MNLWWAKQLTVLSDKRALSMMILLIASLTFVGWISVSTFTEVYNSQASLHTIRELEHEISQLHVRYQDAHPETLEADLKQVENTVIQDFTHLAHWAQDLQEQGERLALRMQYRILKTERVPSSIKGISIVPIELQIRSQEDQSGYMPFLQFLKALDQSGPRIKIQEIIARGDGKKATHFTVGLSTWMKTQNSVEL
jgi:hypothetical protein